MKDDILIDLGEVSEKTMGPEGQLSETIEGQPVKYDGS